MEEITQKEEEPKKPDNKKKNILLVVLADLAVIGIILACVFGTKSCSNGGSGSGGGSDPYASLLNALQNTLDTRKAANWSRNKSMLTIDETTSGETYTLIYTQSPYLLKINGENYTGEDAQTKIDEAWDLYAMYDCEDNIQGLIDTLKNRKDYLTTVSYSSSGTTGFYQFYVEGTLSEEANWTTVSGEFANNMVIKDSRTTDGNTDSIEFGIAF